MGWRRGRVGKRILKCFRDYFPETDTRPAAGLMLGSMRTVNLTRIASTAKLTEPKSPTLKASRVDHRDGAGHLAPVYMASLQQRASYRVRKAKDRAFVSGTSSADPTAQESAEEFLITVTSGENGGESTLDAVLPEENGGPFVVTAAGAEFAYGTDRSNPIGATREPFPKS